MAMEFSPNEILTGDTQQKVVSQIQAIPNPMGNVEQPSYHWKLSMGPDLGNTTVGNVIIAETGLTGFNIVDIQIESIVAPNFQTKNMGSNKFTITISEPAGMSFPDKLILSAKYLGVHNFMKCPYLLSVDFMGYDENGAPARPTGTTWVWKLLVTSLKTDLDATGGRHIIEAVGYDDLGTFNQFSLLDVPMNIDVTKKEGKVGDVMQELAKQINENIKKRYNVNNGGKAPIEIEFKDVPYQNSSGSPVARPFDHKIMRDTKHLDSSRNQGKMQAARGNDIGRIVDYILSASETATALINPSDSPVENNSETKEFSTMHRIECEIENTDYDLISQEYIRKLTFWVVPHDTVRAVNSPSGQNQAFENGRKKLNFALANNYLKKEYNYLYTGDNTEILDFNINLNFVFNVASSLYKGYLSTENSSPGRQFDPDNYLQQTNNTNWLSNTPGQEVVGQIQGPQNRAVLAEDLSSEVVFYPMSFVQDGNDSRQQVNQSIEASNLRTRSIYGTILNQLYGTFDGNLQSVELTIRGDPYWLGRTNAEPIISPSTDEKPNFSNGDHMFLLKFMLPQGFDDEGKPILNLTDTYSGFYATYKVLHRFTDGQFTQILSGVRIPTMSVAKLMGAQ